MSAQRMDNQTYYDAMAADYERERHHGYHVFLDESEVAAVEPFVRGRDVLEVGCGTGLVLQRLKGIARSVRGVDLSEGMLRLARERGLPVEQADATALPFPDASFDAVVCFKVLAHIADVRTAVAEMCRVTRPGGIVAAEFYNRDSLRHLVKRLKRPSRIADGVTDEDVFTRYDTVREMSDLFPADTRVEAYRGVRVAIPSAALVDLPVAGPLAARFDRLLAGTPLARLAGFVVVIARKQ